MESLTATQQDFVFILTECVMEMNTAQMDLMKMKSLVVRKYCLSSIVYSVVNDHWIIPLPPGVYIY